MREDPWHHREKYAKWKAKVANGIEGLCTENSQMLLAFLRDMEVGRHTAIGSRKGGRSASRLNGLRTRMVFLARAFEQRYGVPLTLVQEEQLHEYFGGMRTGAICRHNGQSYRSTGDYVKIFKTFWHWHMKVQRKQGHIVDDICTDLDYQSEKAPWVYLTPENVEQLCTHAKYVYRALMTFLYDAGIRSPTELVNCRVRDFTPDCTQLHIRDEASKTFGRTIKLLLSAALVASYIRERNLGPDDIVFPICPAVANRYLKRLAARVLGDAVSPGGKRYCDLTLYDFRHSSACYWLPRYKSESALKYRFGWKKTEMIHYYTGFLGMHDTITTDDVLMPATRTEIERQLELTQRENALLQERLRTMDEQMADIRRRLSLMPDQS